MIKENLDSVCFIGRITEINPIKDADKIVQAKIGEWSCVVGKNQFNINDLVVVCTTDAVIPEDTATELNITNYLRKGNRVRTVKLKNTYSECLLLEIKQFEQLRNASVYEGKDLQNILGIVKYEEPEIDVIPKVKKVTFNLRKIFKLWMWKSYYRYLLNKFKRWLTSIKANSNFKVYHKFPNIKNAPDIFPDDELVTVQLKLHGSNARYYIERNTLGYSYWVGSHRVVKDVKYTKVNFIKEYLKKLFINGNGFYKTDYWTEISDRYSIENKLKRYLDKYSEVKSIEIYGEIYGAGVQGEFNYGLTDRDAAFFDVQINGIYLDPAHVDNVINELGLKSINNTYITYIYPKTTIYKLAKEENYFNNKWGKNMPHEGVVIKAVKQGETNLRAVKRINPEYLIYADKNNISDHH